MLSPPKCAWLVHVLKCPAQPRHTCFPHLFFLHAITIEPRVIRTESSTTNALNA